MSDTMTQEEAMNMSNEQAVQILITMRNMMCDQYGCPISDAVFALDKAIEALSADRPTWIPCSERLPEEGERILVTAALERVMVAHYGKMFFEKERGNVFYLAGEDGDADITDVVVAWMPLPEPYEEVK